MEISKLAVPVPKSGVGSHKGGSASTLLVLLWGEDLDLIGRLRTTFPVLVPWVCSIDGRGLEREDEEDGWLEMASARLEVETGGGKRAAESLFGRGGGMVGVEVAMVVVAGSDLPADCCG